MMRLFAKLRERSGETLVESLAAILIAALASLLLAVAISGAAQVNSAVREADARIREELATAETHSGASQPGHVMLHFNDGDVQVDVDYWGSSGQLRSYALRAEGGG